MKNPLGPVGTAVQHNVRRYRVEQNLTLAELSRRMEQAGRPVPPLAIMRLEKGERRVEVDDLVVLATALGVSPATLVTTEEEEIVETPERQKLATPDELAAYLGVTRSTLRQWTARGYGPAVIKVGHFRRYRWTDVESWLDEQPKGGGAS